MKYGRLKGAPTARELGLSGSQAGVYEHIMTSKHEGHSPTRVLAGCICVQIKAEEAIAGDFRYHYSSQLDTFILWEVLSVDRERQVCQVKTIDSDSPEVTDYWDGEQSLVETFNKFYRPDPTDRARVEKIGFKSDYIGGAFARPTQPRALYLRLNNFKSGQLTEPEKKGLLHRIGSWLLGY